MDKNINDYKKITPKTVTFEDKLNKMKEILSDSEKCKEIAQKLSDYISQDK